MSKKPMAAILAFIFTLGLFMAGCNDDIGTNGSGTSGGGAGVTGGAAQGGVTGGGVTGGGVSGLPPG